MAIDKPKYNIKTPHAAVIVFNYDDRIGSEDISGVKDTNKLDKIIISTLSTLIFLKTNFNLLLIKYEDICNDPNLIINQLESFFEIKNIDQEKLKHVLSNDSQRDSLISKENIKKRGIEDRSLDETRRFWELNRPEELINHCNLSDYI